MLSAADVGLASCWVAAPIFCPEEAGAALQLDAAWQPHALVLVGYPDPAYRARVRPPVDLATVRVRWVSGREAGRGTTPPSA
jgi:hypothetical protein